MSNVLNVFSQLCALPSDINEHLPLLHSYASRCQHITEFGVRWGVSTMALASGFPKKMVSYDIQPMIEEARRIIESEVNFSFMQADVLTIEIEPTDLLFIDTLHTYDQLRQELALHGNKAKHYLVFHDTETFGVKGEDGNIGIVPAITEFIHANPHWRIIESHTNNNGLMVLSK